MHSRMLLPIVALALASAALARDVNPPGYGDLRVVGAMSFQARDRDVDFAVGKVVNDSDRRATGPVRLELWALTEPYSGAAPQGAKLAERVLAPMRPHTAYNNVTGAGHNVTLPHGRNYLTLLLEEQTGGQWVVRAHYSFPDEPQAPVPAPNGGPALPPPALKNVPLGAGITAENLEHNLNQVNAYRAQAGAPPLVLDVQLSNFAYVGSMQLMRDHTPHQHFKSSNVWASGFQSNAAENQGDPHGWRPMAVSAAIDQILALMMAEGPGGGHHDNILNRAYGRVGIGLTTDATGRLYLTNDFSH